jgi:hypothetical protein
MNNATEDVWARASSKDIAVAIDLKPSFETLINPNFLRSKEMLAQMANGSAA